MGRLAVVAIFATIVVLSSVLKLVGAARMRSFVLPLSALGAREDVADRSSPASDLAVFQCCQRESCLVCLLQPEAVLRLSIGVEALAEELPLRVPLQALIEDLVIQPMVVTVEPRVGEDARLHQVIAEARSFLEMSVDIGQRGLEGPQDHGTVLLANDLVSDSAGGEDGLLSDRSDLGQDLPALGSEDGLEDSSRSILQVRQRLVEGKIWRHVQCHREELLRVQAAYCTL